MTQESASRDLALDTNVNVTPGQQRVAMVKELLPTGLETMLDVGCGRVSPDYPYLDHAARITCVDWNPRIIEPVPDQIAVRSGDFLEMDFEEGSFDAVLCADVFEHVALEQEASFAAGCARFLKPGGTLVVSVPHAGTYAWLDPFEVKPFWNRVQHHLGMHPQMHNGFCDIRKGHKHYTEAELRAAFAPLELTETRRWGYLYDPLASWADGLQRKLGFAPGAARIAQACTTEYGQDFGEKSFNIAVAFTKPLP